jgi:hypothetical protein
MEQSLTELFDQLLALETWLDNECPEATSETPNTFAFTFELRSRLDRIKELKSKVLIENQKMN